MFKKKGWKWNKERILKKENRMEEGIIEKKSNENLD